MLVRSVALRFVAYSPVGGRLLRGLRNLRPLVAT